MTVAILWTCINGAALAYLSYMLVRGNLTKWWKVFYAFGAFVNLVATIGNLTKVAELLQLY